MGKWKKMHEKNVIMEVITEKMEYVQRCVQDMMQINQIVEMGRQKSERDVRIVQQICERNV